MEQATMSQETPEIKTTKNDRIICFLKAFALALAIVCTIAFTFLHEYVPMWSQEYLDHKKEHKKIISSRKSVYTELLSNLENGIITSKEYVIQFRKAKNYHERQLEQYHSAKKEILTRDSILGYWSKKSFYLTISFPVLGLATSMLLLYLVLKKLDDNKEKIFFKIIASAIMVVWVYWIVWSTLSNTQDPERPYDFPRSFYNFALYILPLLFVAITYFTFDSYVTVKQKVASVIYMLNSLLYVDLPKKNFIAPEKTKEFRRLRLDLTRKAQKNAR